MRTVVVKVRPETHHKLKARAKQEGRTLEWLADMVVATAPLLLKELKHLVRLLEPLEQAGTLQVPGLATLNGARAAIEKAEGR